MSEYNKFDKGSEWRKWDLHIHTPLSINQEYGGDTDISWDKFILSLERLPKDVKVIGITDYYFIDGFQKVMNYKKNGRLSNIEKIFPILEFRIDTFGSGNQNKLQKINLHILFDINESKLEKECDKIRSEFIELIPISNVEEYKTKRLKKENFSGIAGTLQDGFESLIPPTKKVFDLLESSTWKDRVFLFLGYTEWSNLEKNQQLRPIKEELYDKVQSFFSSNTNVGNNQKWLDEFGNKKLLHSGDIHNFDFLDTANIDESGDFIESKNYTCLTWIKSDPTFNGLKQISYEPNERVKIQDMKPEEKSGYHVIDSIVLKEKEFWDCEIKFSQNLNSIIGGRSTGKSTLLQSIVKKVNIQKGVSNEEFVEDHLDSIEVKWLDGESSPVRDIEFFYQSQLAEIANDRSSTDKLIEGIIRSKDNSKKLSKFESFVTSNRSNIIGVINELYRVKSDLDLKTTELLELGDKKGVQNEIEKINIELESLNQGLSLSEEEIKKYEELSNQYNLNNETIDRIKLDHPKLEDLKSYSIIHPNFEYNFKDFSSETRILFEQLFANFKTKVDKEWQELIEQKGSELKITLSSLKEDQSSIKKDVIYNKGVELEDKNKDFKLLKNKLLEEQLKLSDIVEKEKSIKSISKKLNELKEDVINLHYLYFEKIHKLTSDLSLSHQGIEIKADFLCNVDELEEFLQQRLNQQSKEKREYISNFVINYLNDVRKYSSNILDKSLNNKLELKGGNIDINVLSELMSRNWLNVTYILNYENDNFSEMSPGKQSFVILKLLLEFNEKKCPILIDQPEDSLDNRSIYNDLVYYLRNKKKERQIILVTHNPNIVVSSDSEQIIVANQNGKDSPNMGNMKFKYVTGSLEHSSSCGDRIIDILESQGVRDHVCEILEGGTEAFTKREQKYEIKGVTF